MKVLVINAGSSSLKYQLINTDNNDVIAKGLCERIGIEGSKLTHKPAGKDEKVFNDKMENHADAIKLVLAALLDKECGVISSMSEIEAVGHRVVHGGEYFAGSVIITDEVKAAVEKCTELAPLHNPANLTGIKACEEVMPGVPQVGVFDTAFHQSMDAKAYLYGLPYNLYEDYKIRKYGFHGTSHKYVSMRAAQMLNKDIKDLKIVTCHLGNGSSVTAVDGGKSVDTSMGFTPLAGTLMGTRSGDIDPAIIPFVMEKTGMDAKEVDKMLNKESGVFGVSGVSSDFRDLDKAASEGNERAKLARDMFVYAIKRYIGYYAAAMGGIDVLVFTAGVGENDGAMRSEMTKGLEFMGIKIDEEKNKVRGKETDITADGARVKTLVVPTNEELMIALETKALVG